MKFIVYGAGYYGLYLCDLMQQWNMSCYCILDRDKNKKGVMWNGSIPVKDIDTLSADARRLPVVIAHSDIKTCDSIRCMLVSEGFADICNIYEFADKYPQLFERQKIIIKIHSEKAFAHKEEIEYVKQIWQDDKSRLLYDEITDMLLKGRLTNFSACPLKEQYFAYDVYKPVENEAFWDVGGGPGGEVLGAFLQKYDKKFYKYVLIEPDKMIRDIRLRYNDKKIDFFQCAVSDKRGKAKIKNYLMMNSLVGEAGDCEVEIFSLEDIAPKIPMTILKIDTEGYEKKILQGGIERIKKNRPVIACAVYHNEEDFWEIPKYLKKELEDYAFYLRSYLNIAETVMYAVPIERGINLL